MQKVYLNMLTIKKNPNEKTYEEATKAVENNNGYCPCAIIKNEDTKCICFDFRKQDYPGECHCGRYIKE